MSGEVGDARKRLAEAADVDQARIHRLLSGDATQLTELEKELRDWLRAQPGGGGWWAVIKAGFQRSRDLGRADRSSSDGLREAVAALAANWARLHAAAMDPECREWTDAASKSLRAVLAAHPAQTDAGERP